MQKKMVVFDHQGGRLANQLWLFASVYSFCLEKKYLCNNICFFPYNKYFKYRSGNFLVDHFFSKIKYRTAKYWYKILRIWVSLFHRRHILRDGGEEFFLDPSIPKSGYNKSALALLNQAQPTTWYLAGWLFRNPVGLEHYRAEIKDFFRPKEPYNGRVKQFVASLRKRYTKVIGVHIRHGDYKVWQGGKFYITFSEARTLLDSFIKEQTEKSIIFVICTDDKVDEAAFAGLAWVRGPGTEIEDLYTLAETDMIIGSNSTYGPWAAYYGNIPFVQFTHEQPVWPIL